LDGEVFEILLTFSDFLSFKEMMVDYKAVCVFWYDETSANPTVPDVKQTLFLAKVYELYDMYFIFLETMNINSYEIPVGFFHCKLK